VWEKQTEKANRGKGASRAAEDTGSADPRSSHQVYQLNKFGGLKGSPLLGEEMLAYRAQAELECTDGSGLNQQCLSGLKGRCRELYTKDDIPGSPSQPGMA
jgi:hypothetical protein